MRFRAALASAAFLFAISATEPARSEGSYAALTPPLPSTKLDNGLRVVFAQNPRSTHVTVTVALPIGSSDEPRRGALELLYRLAWNYSGTKNMPLAEIERALHEDGMLADWHWSQDNTAMHVYAPSSHLARAVWAASEPMASLFDSVDEATYGRAVKSIADARNQNDENEVVFDTLYANVWPEGHPYHHGLYAADEAISTLTSADAKRIHRACIVPNGATVIVTGNFDRARAEEAVRKYFGPIPSSGVEHPCRKPDVASVPPSRAIELGFETGGRNEFVQFVWSTPAFFAADDAALDIAASAIQDRLQDRLVDNMHVAARVSSRQDSHRAGSAFFVRADASENRRAGEVRRAMEDELSRIARDGLSSDEVAIARRKVLAHTVSSSSDPLEVARRISGTVSRDDGLEKLAADADRYVKVDANAVHASIRKWLVLERRVVAVVERKAGAPIQGKFTRAVKQ